MERLEFKQIQQNKFKVKVDVLVFKSYGIVLVKIKLKNSTNKNLTKKERRSALWWY